MPHKVENYDRFSWIVVGINLRQIAHERHENEIDNSHLSWCFWPNAATAGLG
jgi:hypothetical protein